MIFIIVHRLSGAISPRLCNSSVKALRSSVHTVAGGARNWRVRPYATCDTADMTSSSVLAEYVFPREGERVVVCAERAAKFPEETSNAHCDETGHVAWQAMPILCHFILSPAGQRLLKSARVLELGAGIGVPGLLAGRVCRELTLTDSNDTVVEQLRRNVELNRVDLPCASCAASAVHVLNVAWGAESFPPEHVLPRHSVDVVLGSDVVYSAASAHAFLQTARAVMARPGVIVLAYIPRWPSVDRALHDAICEQNLTAENVPLSAFLPAVGDLSPDKSPLPIGTCLLLLRINNGCYTLSGTSASKQIRTPRSLGSEVLDGESSFIKLHLGPEHINDDLPESLCRAVLDSDASSAISVEVDATGPVSVTPLQAEALSRAFCASPLAGRMTQLRLKECWLGDQGWSRLALGLRECSQTLTLLSAEGDEIGLAAATVIARVLPDCLRLVSLCLSHNPLDNYGAITIAGGLASCNVLTFLTLSNCEIGDAGVAALVRALPQALLELDLSSNAITALGLAHVATSLRFLQTPSLTHLNFSGNEVGPGGGAELAEALPIGTPQLERLDLRGCFLADPGVTWLSPALPLCKKLRVLHLGSNGVGDAGAAALAAVLPGCLRLKQLSLAMNSITEEMVHEGSSLISLDMRGNVLGDDGASAIADIIAEVPTLEFIDLSNNDIEDEGGIAFAESLEEGRVAGLTIIMESNRGIIGSVRSRLEAAVASCATVHVKLSPLRVLETGFGR